MWRAETGGSCASCFAYYILDGRCSVLKGVLVVTSIHPSSSLYMHALSGLWIMRIRAHSLSTLFSLGPDTQQGCAVLGLRCWYSLSLSRFQCGTFGCIATGRQRRDMISFRRATQLRSVAGRATACVCSSTRTHFASSDLLRKREMGRSYCVRWHINIYRLSRAQRWLRRESTTKP